MNEIQTLTLIILSLVTLLLASGGEGVANSTSVDAGAPAEEGKDAK